MTTDKWVKLVNALAAEIDEVAASMHPSAWPEQMAGLHQEYRELAKAETYDPPQQMSLFGG